jgi:diaminopimelate epimerase
MTETRPQAFWTMHGLGNKIVVLDLRDSAHIVSGPEAAAIAKRPETAFDQLMVVHRADADGLDAVIRIYNSDGSTAGACGNGMRCVGRVLHEQTGRDRFLCQVGDGLLLVKVAGPDEISVDMGEPKFGWEDVPLSEPFADTRYIELHVGPADAPVLSSPSVMSMGNPHAVFWVDDPYAHDLNKLGPFLENHPLFPDRANITLAHIVDRQSIVMRTWERGAGLTEACGSAACAAAVSAARLRRTDRTVAVTLPGGTLKITWDDRNRVIMTGAAAHVRSGSLTFTADGPDIQIAA